MASGLLPICFGEATKFAQYLLNSDKTYHVKAVLGHRTDTGDLAGNMVAKQNIPQITEADLKRLLAKFRGIQQQIPPMFSALKHQGKPLYLYARAGIDVSRTARNIDIKSLELLSFDGTAFEFMFVVVKALTSASWSMTWVNFWEWVRWSVLCTAHKLAMSKEQAC